MAVQEKQQQKPRQKLTGLFSELDNLLETAVTQDEVKEMLDTVASFIKKMEQQVDAKVAQSKAEMEASAERLISMLENYRVQSDQGRTQDRSETMQSLQKAVQQLRDEVNTVQAMIPELPDYTDRFSEIESKIPTLPKEKLGEDYRNAIEALPEGDKLAIDAVEKLPEKLKELEERIVSARSSGGVTDMRIRQAFKYILHTEVPTGAINGSNLAYTVQHPIFAVVGLVINGEHIAQLPNYTVANRTITFASALPSAYAGKDFEVKYIG